MKVKMESVYMDVIAGTIIFKEGKILMVKEAKKECYSKWAFPAGHIEKNETIFEGAKRETLEETGCKTELKKVFPIIIHNSSKMNIIMLYFLADLVEEGLEYFTNEILEIKWFSLSEIKNMKENEFRSYPVVKTIIDNIENKKLYDLAIIKDLQNI